MAQLYLAGVLSVHVLMEGGVHGSAVPGRCAQRTRLDGEGSAWLSCTWQVCSAYTS